MSDDSAFVMHTCPSAILCGSRKYGIHTPTMERIGNPEGWGSKTREILEGRGVGQSIWFPDAFQFNTDSSMNLAVQNPFLPTTCK